MDDLYAKPSLAAGIESIRRRWPQVESDSQDNPVFLLGAGWGWGSTRLRRALGPACFMWGEPYGHAYVIDSLADSIRSFTLAWPQSDMFHQGQEGNAASREGRGEWYPPVERLLKAHLRFFDELFAQTARKTGAERWGIAEVRWTADHAYYLKWLFPEARFVFLCRNPYDAYRSYVARRKAGKKCYNRWPDHPVTVRGFGRHWRELVLSFQGGCDRVGGLLVRYEDLAAGALQRIRDYLQIPLDVETAQRDVSDDESAPSDSIPDIEFVELENEVAEVASSLGYRHGGGV